MGELSVNIDPKKLRGWMRDSGFTSGYVSSVLGRSKYYIATVLKSQKMSLSTFRLMKKEFGLTDQDLFPEKKEEPALLYLPSPEKRKTGMGDFKANGGIP